ncbi:MAG TPA: metallophosphoesterase [Polyangiaceae bacterium]|nr:metallophosphoesterase [Polyangiaceae bacterium]
MAPRRLLRLVFAGALASPACFVSDPIRLPPLDDNGARPEAGAGGAGGRVEGGDAGSPMGAGGASDRGGAAASAGASGAPSAGAAGAAGDYGPRLRGAPLVFTPTARGFGVSAALEVGDPTQLQAQIRAEGASDWERPVAPRTPAPDLAEWSFDGLEPGVRYEYAITANDADLEAALYTGSAVTQRPPGEPFTFALIADSHIGTDPLFSNQGDWETLSTVSAEVGAASPDFVVNLGDMLDFHNVGFNDPPPNGEWTRTAYLNYRALLGDTVGHAAHFPVIGNWEGENGNFTAEQIAWSREQRLLYVPAPEPGTYPEGGGPGEDYYAFTWGDALFVVLNVMSYTPTEHLLSTYPGVPDDWTLGEAQLGWLADTLANATARWRFVLIHHTVGGAAADEVNAAYGRGGGQAAYVGEQATVHQLLLEHGVQIFFYAHDHVFADMVVDGVHYTEPGSAGAIWMFTQAETGYAESWLESGWGRVEVGPDAVDVALVAVGGQILLEYTLE